MDYETERSVWLEGTKKTPFITLRLIEVRSGKTWHSYLTSVLDPNVLPPYVVADLYRRRWRIEDAFNIVKRLLGLSYLWTGSIIIQKPLDKRLTALTCHQWTGNEF